MGIKRQNDDIAGIAELNLPLPPRVVVIDTDSTIDASLNPRRPIAAPNPAGASMILIVTRSRYPHDFFRI
jgi:hypothetical protein